MRRQQAQEENEARELGLLYSAVPGQQNPQQTQSRKPSADKNMQNHGAYHPGLSPPSSEHDIGQRIHFSGSESGWWYKILITKF